MAITKASGQAVAPAAKGDLVVGSATNDAAVLAVGTNDHVLTADSSTATGLKWAAPAASGGITLISDTVASANSSLSLSSIPSTYKDLVLVWQGIFPSNNSTSFGIRFNNDSTATIYKGKIAPFGSSPTGISSDNTTNAANTNAYPFGPTTNTTSASLGVNAQGILTIYNYASTTRVKQYEMILMHNDINADQKGYHVLSIFDTTTAISSIDIYRAAGTGTFSNATNTSIRLYGVS